MTATSVAPSNRWLYGAIAALLALTIAVQVVRDRGWQPYEPPSGVMWIRSGPLAQRLALGFDTLASDVYWMRAVIYYGNQRLNTRARNYDQLFPLLELVTTLDPHFTVAYRFGAIFLAEPFPGGAGRPDLATELLQKGIATDPKRWEYFQDIGFIHYFWTHDYALAADWFKRAAAVPGAPEWMAPLAATTLAEGGNRESSRLLWTQLRDSTDIKWIRDNAAHRLTQLEAMDSIDELNRSSERFRAKYGRAPATWQELAEAERWRGIPADPTGAAFALDPVTGRVTLREESPLWPLPDGANAASRPKP